MHFDASLVVLSVDVEVQYQELRHEWDEVHRPEACCSPSIVLAARATTDAVGAARRGRVHRRFASVKVTLATRSRKYRITEARAKRVIPRASYHGRPPALPGRQ